MAKESIEILNTKIDVQALLKELNSALAEEWLAFYQYWIGAQIVVGFNRPEVEAEFNEHAMEEFGHAKKLANRIKELDGTPVLTPKEWSEIAICKYIEPRNFDVISLLKDNIAGERCAIAHYQKIAEMTEGKDYVTATLVKEILAEEEQHELDLSDYLDDINNALETIKNYINK